jgi:hypothetical protein
MSLTADLRANLRVAVDHARREQTDWNKHKRCAACGTEVNNKTEDCKTCHTRHGKRKKEMTGA